MEIESLAVEFERGFSTDPFPKAITKGCGAYVEKP